MPKLGQTLERTDIKVIYTQERLDCVLSEWYREHLRVDMTRLLPKWEKNYGIQGVDVANKVHDNPLGTCLHEDWYAVIQSSTCQENA